MKFLEASQLIELLPASPAEVNESLLTFESFTPTAFRNPGMCKHAIDEGFLSPSLVRVAGVSAYFICWRTTSDGGLWVDIAQTLHGGATLAQLLVGVNGLAKAECCRYIRFATRRPGLVRACEKLGFTAEAVLMVKGVQ